MNLVLTRAQASFPVPAQDAGSLVRTWFESAVRFLLDEAVSTDGGVFAFRDSFKPEHCDFNLSYQREKRDLDDERPEQWLWEAFSPERWSHFLALVDRKPGFGVLLDLDYNAGGRMNSDGSFGVLIRSKTVDLPTSFFAVEVVLCAFGRGVSHLPAATDPQPIFALLDAMAELYQCTYAEVSDEPSEEKTAWEERTVGRLEKGLGLSDRYLRGYSWATYCPAHLLDAVGGVEAARGSDAFVAVHEVAGRMVRLQATEEISEFEGDRVRAVHEFLAPILIPGTPMPRKSVSRRVYVPGDGPRKPR